ncbi:hypothetical protein [Nitratireductor thuwali]|uniref:Lipoprotein n=1 Tax=Nitratireductor thuwali TaxID=2267699 RepID=A0ABY5ME63_9HYPH|nr:hypothetical protein NTH_00789 [Nitratireductor thuwali]
MKRIAALLVLCIVSAAVAGCTATDALDPAGRPQAGLQGGGLPAPDGGQASSDPAMQTALAATEEENPLATAPAAINTSARVQFAPVIGATPEAAQPLSSQLSARAAQRGIAITQSGATHLMKGYFSAIADGSQTTVIYVWDLLDPSGKRLHRIQGQQKAPGSTGDGWSSVDGATMQAIANRTIDELAAWLSQNG